MAALNLSRRNIKFLITIICGLHLLYVGVSHYNAAAEKYENSQPFENGLTADGKITVIPDRSVEGVSIRYTDHSGERRDVRLMVDYPEYLRVGQSVQISYEPDSPDWVRVPSLGWSASEYNGWRSMSVVWIVGALSIFPIALWNRFRNSVQKPELKITGSATEIRFRKSYVQLFILWSLYAFVLFVLYAIVTLTITHTLVLPAWLEKLLLLAFHTLLLLKVVLPGLRVLFNDPLTITHRGVSFYGRCSVRWSDMSQIKIIECDGRNMNARLIIALNESSTVKGTLSWQIPLRKMGRVVYLNLYGTRFEHEDVIRSINHFGLDALDPAAAKRLLDTSFETGFICPQETIAIDPASKPLLEGECYMSGGFHIGNR